MNFNTQFHMKADHFVHNTMPIVIFRKRHTQAILRLPNSLCLLLRTTFDVCSNNPLPKRLLGMWIQLECTEGCVLEKPTNFTTLDKLLEYIIQSFVKILDY